MGILSIRAGERRRLFSPIEDWSGLSSPRPVLDRRFTFAAPTVHPCQTRSLAGTGMLPNFGTRKKTVTSSEIYRLIAKCYPIPTRLPALMTTQTECPALYL